jgi:hypothetical protein
LLRNLTEYGKHKFKELVDNTNKLNEKPFNKKHFKLPDYKEMEA